MAIEQKLLDFFLKSKSSAIEFETLEISHSSFSSTYYLVRNSYAGLTATNENDEEVVFEYCPMKIEAGDVTDNLDVVYKITLGDVGEIVRPEIDRVFEDQTFSEKPSVIYRTFSSDDLAKPLQGPFKLEVARFVPTKEGVGFEAQAPYLNLKKTGESYSSSRFPTLKGFL